MWTIALTRHIRDHRAMNGIISTEDFDLNSISHKLLLAPDMTGQDLAKEVICKQSFHWISRTTSKDKKYKIAAVDFGIKLNILRILDVQDCDITVFPVNVSLIEILNYDPDGVLLSNGPGDSAAVTYGIETVKNFSGKNPIFGICFGH